MTSQAVCLLAFSKSNPNKILFVSRKTDSSDFGLPGGKVDPGEDALTALHREVHEETGLTLVNPTPIFSDWVDDRLVTTFLAEVMGDISTTEAGVVQYLPMNTLLTGSFTAYNTKLLAKIS